MPEATPSFIGPYEIVSPPRVGGMGEVFRAWDPRLRREVAIKVLPREVAGDLSKQKRLFEEAQAAGALNHPNVMAVYDIGLHEGRPFVVSEYIHGRELREETDRAPVPLRRVLDLGVQVAAGLCAAHDAGIVHRDLKPSNVMVTREGRVKIIDFGLAKGLDDSVPAESEYTATLSAALAGTPQYMSPEQARGRDIDHRTDQFSFGLILYELLTGAHPFRRESPAETMAAIIADEAVPIAQRAPGTPAPVRWIVERCLAKDREDRYVSTFDLLKDLTNVQQRMGELSGESSIATRTSTRMWAALASTAAIIAALAVIQSLPREASPALRFTPLVSDAPFQGAPAWSPDGKTLAYVSAVDGVLQIFTRGAESGLSHQLTQSRFDATDPFWTPDGQRIFYHSLAHESESLWSVSATGGPPRLVVENASRAALAPDGRTLVLLRESAAQQSVFGFGLSLALADISGEDVRPYEASPFKDKTFVDGSLRFSPDGTKLLVWVWGWTNDPSSAPRPEFWMVPWPEGRPTQVLSALASIAPAAPAFDWLPDSRHIVLALGEPGAAGTHLWTADIESGARSLLTMTPGSENRPAVSPDGRQVAFTFEAIDFDLVQIPLDGGAARSLLSSSRSELDPTMSRDGAEYAYISDKGGKLQIWLRSRDGRFERPVVTPDQFDGAPTLALGSPALAPDGSRIAFQRYADDVGYQIYVSTLAAAGTPLPLTRPSRYQDAPSWSPDGQWIAFLERVGDDISLARVRVGAGSTPEVILSGLPRAGSRAKWSPDGRWIVCDTMEGLTAVSVDGTERRLVSEDSWIAFEWSQDSQRIYGLRESDQFPRHYMLAALDLGTGGERIINADVGIIPPAFQPIRGLERLGDAAVVTSAARARSDIWVLEGFAPVGGRSRWFLRR